MKRKRLTERDVNLFCEHLIMEEKSKATVEKYVRDVRRFIAFAGRAAVNKELVLKWKETLGREYAVSTINSMLASLNSMLDFFGLSECRVKNLKTQRQTYCPKEKELSISEYKRLLSAADERLRLIMETICGTGIRVSELKYFTVEEVKSGRAEIRCKGKARTILIPDKLKRLLLKYAAKRKIREGVIFVTKNGNPLDRSNIWAQMKKLCEAAAVDPRKVFPHNLRKLFARTFYSIEKDIAKLADVLGHSSISTTRIYIMTTYSEHLKQLDKLGLII